MIDYLTRFLAKLSEEENGQQTETLRHTSSEMTSSMSCISHLDLYIDSIGTEVQVMYEFALNRSKM